MKVMKIYFDTRNRISSRFPPLLWSLFSRKLETHDENSDGMLDFDEFSKMMQIYSSGGESGHHESI